MPPWKNKRTEQGVTYSFNGEMYSVQTALTDCTTLKATWEKTGSISLACVEPSSGPRGLWTTGISEASTFPVGVSWCWWRLPGCWGGQPSVESSFCLQWKDDPPIWGRCDTKVQDCTLGSAFHRWRSEASKAKAKGPTGGPASRLSSRRLWASRKQPNQACDFAGSQMPLPSSLPPTSLSSSVNTVTASRVCLTCISSLNPTSLSAPQNLQGRHNPYPSTSTCSSAHPPLCPFSGTHSNPQPPQHTGASSQATVRWPLSF